MPKTKEERWFGMRLTPAQKAKIERLSHQKGTNQKEAVLEAVDESLNENLPVEVREGSFLDGIEDVIASVEGPGDLSTNPAHMEGFGRS